MQGTSQMRLISGPDCKVGGVTRTCVSSTNTLTISSACGTTNCSAGTSINVTFTAINFAYVSNASETMTISTLTSDNYLIDQTTKQISDTLLPALISISSVSRTSSKSADLISFYFTITHPQNILPNIYLITLTQGVLYKASFPPFLNINSLPATLLSYTLFPDNSLNTLTILSPCISSCTSLSFEIDKSVLNPPFQTTTPQILSLTSLTTSLQTMAYGTDTSSLSALSPITPQDGGIIIYPLDPTAGERTKYRIEVDAVLIPTNSSLVVTLPPGVKIEDLFGENVVTGGNLSVTETVDANGNTVVTIKNFTGASEYDTVSGKYIIDIGWITNPPSGPLTPISIQITTPDGTVIVDPGDQTINITDPISTCDSNCLKCAGTPSTCTSCTVPGDFPLLQQGTCVKECSDGYFKVQGYCITCYQDCESCLSSAPTCSQCPPNEILIDGICYDELTCPGNLVLVNN